jgi:antibiotic biosynthesis monooxygenase (ABM) superfamily enzyme
MNNDRLSLLEDCEISKRSVLSYTDAEISKLREFAEVRKEHAAAAHYEGVVKDQDQNRLERSRYANKLFVMECIFIFLLLLLVGLSRYLGLSDAVLIVLITTGLSSIVSIFVFVVRYLFSED